MINGGVDAILVDRPDLLQAKAATVARRHDRGDGVRPAYP